MISLSQRDSCDQIDDEAADLWKALTLEAIESDTTSITVKLTGYPKALLAYLAKNDIGKYVMFSDFTATGILQVRGILLKCSQNKHYWGIPNVFIS